MKNNLLSILIIPIYELFYYYLFLLIIFYYFILITIELYMDFIFIFYMVKLINLTTLHKISSEIVFFFS